VAGLDLVGQSLRVSVKSTIRINGTSFPSLTHLAPKQGQPTGPEIRDKGSWVAWCWDGAELVERETLPTIAHCWIYSDPACSRHLIALAEPLWVLETA
jgi:hypothetical protein